MKRTALIVIAAVAAAALAQVYVIDRGQQLAMLPGHVTWVRVQDAYTTKDDDGNPVTRYYTHVVRADAIIGTGGAFRWWSHDGEMFERLSLYVTGERYPTCRLGPIPENQDWNVAIAAVVDENPGGIVELTDYLP